MTDEIDYLSAIEEEQVRHRAGQRRRSTTRASFIDELVVVPLQERVHAVDARTRSTTWTCRRSRSCRWPRR
ncbi:MAG: hypothetical protein MZW92_51375 [Comamonadaceae bacterium]|nr:hypothetical protein [Comamonadaceae bacterium]